MDRWGQYFKPAGMGQATGDPHKAYTPRAAATKPAVEEDAPFDVDEPAVKASAPAAQPASDGASRAQDILAMIRNRQKQ